MELIHIDKIYPASYNPRNTDPERIEILKLSLIKLGFLLPIYVNEEYGILSGHQRQIAARELGIKEVPVKVLKIDSLDKEMRINIAFNRGTNDMEKEHLTGDLADYLRERKDDILDKIADAPDKRDEGLYPCLKLVSVDAQTLKEVNRGRFNNGVRNSYKDLYDLTKEIQPIVITEDRRIINGLGRFFYCISKGIKEFDCVVIPYEESDVADMMLNKLTMDFNFEEKYGDILRYNSYRRANGVRDFLGMAYTIGVHAGSPKSFDIYSPIDRYNWEQVYGDTILDFGAGLMEEVGMLRDNGIKAIPLEPFVLKKQEDGRHLDELDVDRARKLIGEFLDEVDNGVKFTSVISQTILNSIPFREDREKYLLLLSLFCDEETTAFIGTSSNLSPLSVRRYKADTISTEAQRTRSFRLDYEENVTIAEVRRNPKMQKFHTRGEFADLVTPYFKEIRFTNKGSNIYAICKEPTYDFTKKELADAIDFEFNLPYPKKERLNMHERAKEVLFRRAEKLKIFDR